MICLYYLYLSNYLYDYIDLIPQKVCLVKVTEIEIL